MENHKKTFHITAEYGLHARPASGFVQKAISIPVPVLLHKNNTTINAKSLVQVMGLQIIKNDTITIEIESMDTKHMKVIENYLKENKIIS